MGARFGAGTSSTRDGRRRSSPRSLVGVALGVAAVVGLGGLAAADGLIDLSPSAGPAGSRYTVTVHCDEEPTLTDRPLTPEGPPGTVPPVSVEAAGAGTWTYEGTAGSWDDQLGAVCGDVVETARFDTDAPRLFLGPVPETPFPRPGGRTTLEGTDCPAGSTVEGIFVVEGDMASPFTATPGARGDWSVPIPAWALGREFEATATCGSVTYDRYAAAPIESAPDGVVPTQPQSDPQVTVPATSPTATVPSAAAPAPVAGAADYTG